MDNPDINTNVVVKKPFYKKWWFWLIIIILLIGGAGASQEKETETTPTNTTVTTESNKKAVSVKSQVKHTKIRHKVYRWFCHKLYHSAQDRFSVGQAVGIA